MVIHYFLMYVLQSNKPHKPTTSVAYLMPLPVCESRATSVPCLTLWASLHGIQPQGDATLVAAYQIIARVPSHTEHYLRSLHGTRQITDAVRDPEGNERAAL
jgi:hypothetical protein